MYLSRHRFRAFPELQRDPSNQRGGSKPVDSGGCHALHQRAGPPVGPTCRSFPQTCTYGICKLVCLYIFLDLKSYFSVSLLPLACFRRLTGRLCFYFEVTWWWNTWAWSLVLPSNSHSTSTSWNRVAKHMRLTPPLFHQAHSLVEYWSPLKHYFRYIGDFWMCVSLSVTFLCLLVLIGMVPITCSTLLPVVMMGSVN